MKVASKSWMEREKQAIRVICGSWAPPNSSMYVLNITKAEAEKGPRIPLNNTKDFYKQMRMKYMT